MTTATPSSLGREKPNSNTSNKKRLMVSAVSVSVLAVLVVVCGLSWGSVGTSDNAGVSNDTSLSWIQSVRRKAIVYSKVSEITPDPDQTPAGDDVKDELAAKYGRWHFWDGEEDVRPDDSDLCGKFPPHCDVPGDDFPEDVWQGDAVFVNHILNDADGLITRAMEAIFEEYGHPKPKTAEGLSERMKMFHWDKIDLATEDGPPTAFKKGGKRGNGGWTTKRSFEGLVRRLLHAIMTNGTFTVVLAGHSAAAGHGNHFRQSYIMQMHKVMAPIFARLGVKLITRNISQGGLGTLQNAMAAGNIYGSDVDLLIWDSGMTEKMYPEHIDLFFRQGILGGNRVPVIWSAGGQFNTLKMLHEEADVDVGEFGLGSDGIEKTVSVEQAKKLPWAAQYLICDPENQAVCKEADGYCAKCWVPRDDGIKPEAAQKETFGSQVSWHPGWRRHQLTGRVIAFSILEALQQAVQQFSEGTMGGPPLADDFWHVGEYYDNIRKKLKNLDPSKGECYKIKDKLPERMCKTAMMGRTQYTPRADFKESSLISIVKPAANGYMPKNDKQALYEGPDAHNECYDIPPGEVDVLSIVSGRRRELSELPFNARPVNISTTVPAKLSTKSLREAAPKVPKEADYDELESMSALEEQQHRDLGEIKPGKGWELFDEPQGNCDGTYDAVCSRWTHHPCVLKGHHDARGSLVGNGLSGWLVMTLKGLKEGMIVLKVHTWQAIADNTITKEWTNENNERQRMLELEGDNYEYGDAAPEHERSLARQDPAEKLPDTFKFEFAVNGKITSWTKKDYIENRQKLQRVVETFTLLDNPDFTKEEADVELAVRVTGGCGRDCTIGVSHVYWA